MKLKFFSKAQSYNSNIWQKQMQEISSESEIQSGHSRNGSLSIEKIALQEK